jgi:hypothetical protein
VATLLQLRSRVRFFIDEATQKNFTDGDINYAINRGQENVVKEIQHLYEDFFEKPVALNPNATPPGTVPGVELYTLPTDFLKFKRIERTDTGETIPPIDLNEKSTFGNAIPALVNMAGAGSGLSYYVSGNNVGFTPVSTDYIPITMTYVYRPADLVNDGDVSEIPAEWHDMMAVSAARDCVIKDEGDTTPYDTLWNNYLGSLMRTLRQRQIQDPKRVRRVDVGFQNWRPF